MIKDLNLARYTKVFLITGYTDLRMGQTGLVNLVQFKLGLNPFDQSAVFLFCGRKASVIKALCCEGDGFVLASKKLLRGRYQWPRNQSEARILTKDQYIQLMSGFSIESTIENTF